jgi:Fur family transcriptional regulator, iron response regulator
MPDKAQELPIQRLRRTGLRPTRQRVALAELLFGRGDWHFTAEMVHAEATKHGVPVSLATVYNTLHQFVEAGLLREVAVESSKTYFDTKTSSHYHFFFEDSGGLEDVPVQELAVKNLPEPPQGWEIGRVDVLVRLVPKQR